MTDPTHLADPAIAAHPTTAGVAAYLAPRVDLAAIGERFAGQIVAVDDGAGAGEPAALVDRAAIADVARFLRDARGYQLLRSVTAVDFLPADPRFHVVYHLSALPPHVVAGDATPRSEAPARLVRLKVAVPESDPVVPTLTGVYPTANWHEREVYDLFGIEFAGHPDLRRILMPPDYDGFPLRKDHPLRYEEVAFSFNQEAVYAAKPFARE